MWQMTRDMYMWWGVNILSKFQLPSSYGLGETVFWEYFLKGWLSLLLSPLMTKVFVEQPQLHRVC